jgi:DNA phosphorothioation-dependent restriction protein DptG
MRYKLVVVDRKELKAGEKEEAGEHHLSPDDAESVTAQHLTKHPNYYSDLEKVGLNESLNAIKTAAANFIKPILNNQKAKEEARKISNKIAQIGFSSINLNALGKTSKFGAYSLSAGLAYAAWAQRNNPQEAMQLLKTAKEVASLALKSKEGNSTQSVPELGQTVLDIAGDTFLKEEIKTGQHFPFSDKKVVGKGRLGRKMKHPSTTVGSSLPVSGPR